MERYLQFLLKRRHEIHQRRMNDQQGELMSETVLNNQSEKYNLSQTQKEVLALYNKVFLSENVFKKRSIIVVGKTGAGKSKLLNEILDKTIFKTSASIESCTSKVESSGYKNVKYKSPLNQFM